MKVRYDKIKRSASYDLVFRDHKVLDQVRDEVFSVKRGFT